jgi:hypothetical protein
VAAVRYVPTGGALTGPEVRTIVTANAGVTTILPVANGIYWGDRNGALQLEVDSVISTIQASPSLVPTSIGTNGFTAGGALIWTECAATTCRVRFELPVLSLTLAAGDNALGASMNSSGDAFWGDDFGLHRLVF